MAAKSIDFEAIKRHVKSERAHGRGYGLKRKARPMPKSKSRPAVPPSFKPLANGDDLRRPSKATRERVKRAADKLPSESKLKQYPTLKRYTPAQRKTIEREQTKALKGIARERGYFSDAAEGYRRGEEVDPADLLIQNLNREDRRQVHKLYGLTRTNSVREDARNFRKLTGARKVKGGERAQAEALREHGIETAIKAKALPEEKGMSFGGTTKIAGVRIPGLHQLGFAADQILDNVQRPANALAGAAYATRLHDDPLKGAVDSFLRKPRRTRTWGDVLDRSGLGPTASAIGGVAADIATDPLNLVTLGAAPVAENVLKHSRQLLSRSDELRAAGHVAKGDKLRAQADVIAASAQRLPANKGVQVGVRVPGSGRRIATTGEGSARLNKALGGSSLATAVRESAPAQRIGTALLHDFRPAGVASEEWETFRDAERVARAKSTQGTKAAERRATAYRAEIKRAAKADGFEGNASAAVIAALERAARPKGGTDSIHALPANLKRVAITLRKDYKTLAHLEHDTGVLGTVRSNYVTHVLTPQARREAARSPRSGIRSNPYAKQREDAERSIAEINAQTPGKFSEDVGVTYGERAAKSAQRLAQKDYDDHVARELARPYKPGEIRSIDEMYVHGPKGLRRAGEAIHWPGGSAVKLPENLAADERLVTLPKSIGDAVIDGPVGKATIQLPGFDKVMGKVKTLLTTLNVPAYQARNFAGDSFLAYQADTDPTAFVDAARLLRLQGKDHKAQRRYLTPELADDATIDLGDGLRVPAADLLREMREQGVIDTGFYGLDLDEAARLTKGRRTKQGRRGPVERIRERSAALEDLPRAATYLSARRRRMTPDEAASWTLKHHFDYGDLTDAERNFIRRVIPFYTFTGRNTRLQATKLLQRPGKAANYGLAMEEARKQAGLPEDYEDRLPDYYRRGLGMPLNFRGNRKLLFPQLPITDLNRMANAGDPAKQIELLLQGLNPLVKIPAEVMFNYSMFFRDPIWQDSEHPDAPKYRPAPGYIKALPMAVRVMFAGGDKDAAKQGLWTAKADYFGRLTPQQNTLTQTTTQATGSRGQGIADALVSQLTGIKVNDFEPAKYRLDALYDRRNELDAKAANMRKLGMDNRPAYDRLLKNRRGVEKDIDAARKQTGQATRKRRSRAKNGYLGAPLYGGEGALGPSLSGGGGGSGGGFGSGAYGSGSYNAGGGGF